MAASGRQLVRFGVAVGWTLDDGSHGVASPRVSSRNPYEARGDRGREPPGVEVCEAFGCDGVLESLPGGEGRTWRCGALALRPVDDEEQASWTAAMLAGLELPNEIVVPRPVATAEGRWVSAGWTCTRYVDARHESGRWADILAAGRRFHSCLSGITRPVWMDRTSDWWRRADAVAWERRAPVGPNAYLEVLDRLFALRRPLELPAQVVHADLCGNVLFDGHGRAVILDVSAYWRPVEWASAVVSIDAFEWEAAGPSALSWLDGVDRSGQLLVRARRDGFSLRGTRSRGGAGAPGRRGCPSRRSCRSRS